MVEWWWCLWLRQGAVGGYDDGDGDADDGSGHSRNVTCGVGEAVVVLLHCVA